MPLLRLNSAMMKYLNMPGLPSFACKRLRAQCNVQDAAQIRKLLSQMASQAAFQVITGQKACAPLLNQTKNMHGYDYKKAPRSLQVSLDPANLMPQSIRLWIHDQADK